MILKLVAVSPECRLGNSRINFAVSAVVRIGRIGRGSKGPVVAVGDDVTPGSMWDREGMVGKATAGYSGTPLAGKLGIKADSLALLDGAPDGFDLGELPDGVRLHRRAGRLPYPVIVCFCRNRAVLERRWPALHPLTTAAGALWIAWPKRSSGIPSDLDDGVVRDYALAHGRVDVKVCAIDSAWSGLKHVVRVVDR